MQIVGAELVQVCWCGRLGKRLGIQDDYCREVHDRYWYEACSNLVNDCDARETVTIDASAE